MTAPEERVEMASASQPHLIVHFTVQIKSILSPDLPAYLTALAGQTEEREGTSWR